MRIFAVDPGLVTGMALLDTVQRTFQVWQEDMRGERKEEVTGDSSGWR